MNVYQVIFEDPSETEIKQIVEMVGGKSFKSVSDAMTRRADEMGWALRCVRHAMTIVEIVD